MQSTLESNEVAIRNSGSGLALLATAFLLVAASLKYFARSKVLTDIANIDSRFFWVGVIVFIFPVLAFGALDFAKAQKREYAPPTLRVQFTRAIVYGLCLTAANLFLFLSQDSSFLVRLHQTKPGLWLVLAPLPAYALLCWYVCLRRRQFDAVSLPSFREAASALAHTNDFVLGRTGTDWKTGGGDARWCVVPERAMFANIYVLGGIGSGKTSAAAKPLLEQALFKFPGDEKHKVGIFLLDAKGNNAEHVLERARAAGREKDVVILKPGGHFSYNPLAEGNPTALANKLVAALEVMTAQESHSYYKKMQREFAENTFQILSDVLGPGRFTLMDIYDFICDEKIRKKWLDAARPKNSISYRWFTNQWAKEDSREQMMLTKGFRADLSSFVRDEIAPTFSVANPTFPGWTTLIDEGRIVVFSMSLDEYGDFARAMGIFVLMDFQSAMMARTTARFKQSGGNVQRLVMCFIDEVWAYMNPKLAEFTSVSREAKCCTVALHQGLDQIPPHYRNVVIGNFRTPVIMSVNDLLSLETFSKLFGTHKVSRKTRSEGSSFSGVGHRLLADAVTARAGGEGRSVAISETEMDEPRFSTDDILHLGKFKAIVQMYDGEVTHLPRVVELLPGYLPDNQLERQR